jgi:hypothetical protein
MTTRVPNRQPCAAVAYRLVVVRYRVLIAGRSRVSTSALHAGGWPYIMASGDGFGTFPTAGSRQLLRDQPTTFVTCWTGRGAAPSTPLWPTLTCGPSSQKDLMHSRSGISREEDVPGLGAQRVVERDFGEGARQPPS